MQNKVRQVTDSIHGTIYISELEYQMISTPFFYRLHDVYQSSTVYMTFPSNRTKRYEHSLGTMELAGQMFYSAITNATTKDRKDLLLGIQDQFKKVLSFLRDRNKLNGIGIYQSESNGLGRLIPREYCSMDSFINLLNETKDLVPLYDRALCKQEVCFFDLLDKSNDESVKMIPVYSFLYQCVLEALRIAALFHDIGHPPFSHIIEFTLKKLYGKDKQNYNSKKVDEFEQYLEKFIRSTAVEHMLIEHENKDASLSDPALHEQIGLHILYNAYKGVMSHKVSEWNRAITDKTNRLRAIYLVTVIEFTFAILLEKNSIFSSLHRLIDGPVDADRLDYNVRDSHNAGVDWGTVPYSRLISGAKFSYQNNKFVIAFPEKVCEDIDDLLVNRYKIFQRINYHHKSVKTSELLQRSVEMLAEDYLMSEPNEEIMPEISMLWTSLGSAFGQCEVENQISQWTDSWLVSVLSNTLIKLSSVVEREKLINTSMGRTDEVLDKLYRMLEEVQLNRKRYFPLLKRQNDALRLKSKIVEKAGIDEAALSKLSNHEYNKLVEENGEGFDSALEALHRIGHLQTGILDVANLGLLDIFFPGEISIQELIMSVLQQAQEKNQIRDYFIWENIGFDKLGVANTTDIYLYRSGGDVYKYNVATTLLRKLNAQKAGCLWLYAYVCPSEQSEVAVNALIDNMFDEISTVIGNSIHSVMNELFDYDAVIHGEEKNRVFSTEYSVADMACI